MREIVIAKEFTKTPGGRFRRGGPGSGEAFRDILCAALKKDDKVLVVLDGTEGYGSSFLEEAFGGMVRNGLVSADDALDKIEIVARTSPFKSYADEALVYLKEAVERAKRIGH
ncbi:STAS-like domain-containing protein [Asaia bogorensis]|uniref:STAS-like domain-containing protein n=1 Tax=Asaia bogorensis TaxID=91915 RepID=UPI0028644CCC|nr:STAS-like domain-containing protein [Asaia bogorensis]MDR6181616.1 hypothetical protein [Asaia bogorensis NBRC 16594]